MRKKRIAVIGLGYVGLPLARLLATKYSVLGFDINTNRLEELKNNIDSTHELSTKQLVSVQKTSNNDEIGLFFSNNTEDLLASNFYIVTVPTPVDKHNKPDLTPLYRASETIGKVLKVGDIVVYESTVYPGVTEYECVPVLEQTSGLKYNSDFFVGYSPERINPGDKNYTVEKILKVTSGSTPDTADIVDEVYHSVIEVGTYKAPSIQVAEAAKVIENSQRDINIAFVNELSKIFHVLGIDTQEVLEAAATKWNFVHYKPGLVGGHCIGVDPYYLAQIAQENGYIPEIILAGRRMNDTMAEYIASQIVKLMIQKDIQINYAHILILGFTFKENCPDIRNTKVIDLKKSLKEYGIQVDVYDPQADPDQVLREYNIELKTSLPNIRYDGIVIAVAHNEFKSIDLNQYKKEKAIIYDIKGMRTKSEVDERL